MTLSGEFSEDVGNPAVESQNYALMRQSNGYQRRIPFHPLQIRRQGLIQENDPQFVDPCVENFDILEPFPEK